MAAVPTAPGDTVDSTELGFTQPTEMIDTVTCTDIDVNWPDVSCGARPLEDRTEDAVRKLTHAKERGLDRIDDRALPVTGRNVNRTKTVAERVPLDIIVCTGWHSGNELPFCWGFPAERRRHDRGCVPVARGSAFVISRRGSATRVIVPTREVRHRPSWNDARSRVLRASRSARPSPHTPARTSMGSGDVELATCMTASRRTRSVA